MCGGELIIYYKLVQVMQLGDLSGRHDVLAITYPQFRALMPSDARVFPAITHSWVPLQLCPWPKRATLPKIHPLPSGSPHPATHGCWDAKAWLPYFNSRHLWNVIQVSEFSKRSAEDSVSGVCVAVYFLLLPVLSSLLHRCCSWDPLTPSPITTCTKISISESVPWGS